MTGDIIRELPKGLVTPGGTVYRVRVRGRASREGGWEGWIEFERASGTGDGERFPSPVEMRQPSRKEIDGWAAGLSAAYLGGALARALEWRERQNEIAARPAAAGAPQR